MIRFPTGLAIVPGAVSPSVAAPASMQIRNSSHRENPGGSRSSRLPCARQLYSRTAIGMASRMNM